MRISAAMLLLFARAKPDDKAAHELFNAMRDKIEKAETLRVESRMTATQANMTFTVDYSVKVKGASRWTMDFEMKAGGWDSGRLPKFSALYDGRRMVSRGSTEGMADEGLKPEEMAAGIRRGVTSGIPTGGIFGMKPGGEKAPTMGPVRDGGREKVDDREARIIEFIVKDGPGMPPGQDMKMRVFIDLSTKLPLKREYTAGGVTWTETFRTLALDEDIPDSDFSIQSKRSLARARVSQLATSVRLFGLFTGRHPQTLEELVRRPAGLGGEIFWPERGFLLGGVVPKDPWGRPFELITERGRVAVVSRGADGKPGGKGDDQDAEVEVPPPTRSAVGAPSDRLKKHYTARVELQLLAAAVRAWRDSYGELPKKRAALWEKPEWADVWPEGGWLPGGAVPVDPWGDPYRIISDVRYVRVQLKDPRARALGAKQLTPEERKALEEVAQPRLGDEERKAVARLIDQLGEDDLETRERAEGELRAMGPWVAPLLDERLRKEKQGEAALRLTGVRKSLPTRRPGWASELATQSFTVRAEDAASGGGAADERHAMGCLKTLSTAEADFRANDRDNNRVNDFWTGDVAGLYTLVPEGSNNPDHAIKLIEQSVALADAAPLDDGAALERYGDREPKSGYWFRVMLRDNSVTPAEEYQQDAIGAKAGSPKVHHNSRFAFCCYPAEYGVTGKRTFIINESNTVFWKDTGGEQVLEWPSDAELGTWNHEN